MPSQPNNIKILVLGDYQFLKVKRLLDNSHSIKLSNCGNMTWKCSYWQTIKSAMKEYFKYRDINGPPSIVILQVGNVDLTKVSTPNVIITSLLRTAKTLYKNGVSLVIICSLTERQLSVGNYNAQVAKINGVLASRSAKTSYLYFFVTLNTKLFDADEIYTCNGRDLVMKPQNKIIDNLKGILENKNFQQMVRKDEQHLQSYKNSNDDYSRKISSTPNISVFESEINLLKLKLNLMVKEKTKTDEHASKLDDAIVQLNLYLTQLQSVVSE